MNKRRLWINTIVFAVASVLIIAAVRPQDVMAYFTTHAEAKGLETVHLGHDTTIEEKNIDGKKVISITASDDSIPVFLRAKAFCEYDLSFTPGTDERGGTWVQGSEADEDGNYYYYYTIPLNAGETAATLTVGVNDVKIDEKHNKGDTFDIIVVYETVPVLWEPDENGAEKPITGYDDPETWSRKVDVNEMKSTGRE